MIDSLSLERIDIVSHSGGLSSSEVLGRSAVLSVDGAELSAYDVALAVQYRGTASADSAVEVLL